MQPSDKPMVLLACASKEACDRLAKALGDEFELLTADDGLKAMWRIESSGRRLRAVAMELMLPGMSGYEILKLMHEKSGLCNAPVLGILPAGQEQSARDRALSLGVVELLGPEPSAQKLREKLRMLCATRTITIPSCTDSLPRYYDSVTNIFNRESFFYQADQRLQSDSRSHAFVCLRLGRFCELGSYLELDALNELLHMLAQQLRILLYGIGSFGRISEDCFAAVFPEERLDATVFVQRMVESLLPLETQYHMLLRFGICFTAQNEAASEQLYKRALLAVESLGDTQNESRCAFYDEALGSRAARERLLLTQLESAMNSEQFFLNFQPQFYLHDFTLAGAEALCRWQHPEEGCLTPDLFLPMLEKRGLLAQFDLYVLEKVCAQLQQWCAQGLCVPRISVNISTAGLGNPRLCERFCALAAQYGVSPSRLTLEFPCTGYAQNPRLFATLVQELRQAGFAVVLDLFGAPGTLPGILGEVPADGLKLAPEFAADFERNVRIGSVVTAAVHLGVWLRYQVIATAVETPHQALYFFAAGCQQGQGYLFFAPLAVREFEKLLRGELSLDARLQTPQESPPLLNSAPKSSAWETMALFDQAPNPVGLYEFINGNLCNVRANEALYRLFGFAYEQTARPEIDRLTMLERPALLQLMRHACLAAGQAHDELFCSGTPRGSFWVRATVRRLRDYRQGELLFVALRDISQERKLQRQLALERSRTLFTQPLDELFLLDLSTNRVERIFSEKQHLLYEEGQRYPQFVKQNAAQMEAQQQFLAFMEPVALQDRLLNDQSDGTLTLPSEAGDAAYRALMLRPFSENSNDCFLCGVAVVQPLPAILPAMPPNAVGAGDDPFLTPEAVAALDLFPTACVVYRMDEALTAVYINEAAHTLHGYTPAQYLQAGESNVAGRELRACLREMFRYTQPGTTMVSTFLCHRRGGSLQWIELTAKLTQAAGGQLYACTLQRDATAEVRAKRRHRSVFEYYRMLVDDSKAILLDFDAETGEAVYSLQLPEGGRRRVVHQDYLKQLPQDDMVHHEDRQPLLQRLESAIAVSGRGEIELRADFDTCGYRWYRFSYLSVTDEDEQVFRIVGSFNDIERQKQIEQQLAHEQEYRNAIAAKALLIYEWDLSGGQTTVLHTSELFQSRFYDSTNYLLSDRCTEMVYPQDVVLIKSHFSRSMLAERLQNREGAATCRCRIRARNDQWVWVEVTTHVFKDGEGRLKCIAYAVLIDREMRDRDALQQRAERDALSGLFNRATAERRIIRLLEEGMTGAFALVDLDNFKQVNDLFGHQVGDRLIGLVGETLRSSFRSGDVTGRLGGDEFALLLRGSNDPNAILLRLERICDSLKQALQGQACQTHVSLSIGVALVPQHGEDFDTLYRRADEALYRAKANGKDRVCIYGVPQ